MQDKIVQKTNTISSLSTYLSDKTRDSFIGGSLIPPTIVIYIFVQLYMSIQERDRGNWKQSKQKSLFTQFIFFKYPPILQEVICDELIDNKPGGFIYKICGEQVQIYVPLVMPDFHLGGCQALSS